MTSRSIRLAFDRAKTDPLFAVELVALIRDREDWAREAADEGIYVIDGKLVEKKYRRAA